MGPGLGLEPCPHVFPAPPSRLGVRLKARRVGPGPWGVCKGRAHSLVLAASDPPARLGRLLLPEA